MVALNTFSMFSNKFTFKKYLKIRKFLCITRWIANLVAIFAICHFKFYEVAIVMAIIMLVSAITDVVFFVFIEKLISENKGE